MAKIFDLVSKDYIPATCVAGGALAAGVNTQEADSAGFTLTDVAASGDKYTAILWAAAVRGLKVAASEVIVAGDKLYWDHSAKKVTATVGSLTVTIGYALEASANGDTTVLMSFDGLGKTYA